MSEYVCTACRLEVHERCGDLACLCADAACELAKDVTT